MFDESVGEGDVTVDMGGLGRVVGEELDNVVRGSVFMLDGLAEDFESFRRLVDGAECVACR